VLYAHDAAIGSIAPRWGTAGATSDGCPTPPGATDDGCVVSGRLSLLRAAGDVMTGAETVLIEDWCQQYPSHSVGSLAFGADGMLYVSGGDGASFNFTDFGQDGNPRNPCGDPPVPVGGSQTAPTAAGGALRSQDVRTAGDTTSLDGAILRVDPATGEGPADNPFGNTSNDASLPRCSRASSRRRTARRRSRPDTVRRDRSSGPPRTSCP
jgi:glucose/arabinose dehydrogenase